MTLRTWLSEVSLPVYFTVMFFAVASWVDINGLFVELPLLVNALPEGWNLPSYLVIIIQVANIGPLVYTVANRLFPTKVKEWPVIFLIIAVGAVACVLLSFFWSYTAEIGGEEHSVALLSLATLLAFVDCTSSVVFLPYMASFRPQYMTAFYIGEGLSGLLPGLVGLAQGVGGEPDCVNASVVRVNGSWNWTEWEVTPEYAPPRFSVQVFFLFMTALMVVSGLCFSCLHFSPRCRRERSAAGLVQTNYNNDSMPCEEIQFHSYSCEASSAQLASPVVEDRDLEGKDVSQPALSQAQFFFLMAVTAWLNGLTNGVLPSTASYSALPYGNTAYSLTVRLGAVANPVACFLALLLPTTSLWAIGALSGLGTVLTGYQLYLAAMSPYPPLQGEVLGEVLLISTSLLLVMAFSYCKVAIASVLQAEGGRRALLLCGIFTQVGSFCGAVIIFICVNTLELFESTYPCTD